jgi:AcrR family transcriptional regulator
MTALEENRSTQPSDVTAWRSAHIHYYDNLDELILDAVQPVLDRLRADVDKAYWIRHWRRGPHLRLNIHTTSRTWDQIVHPALQEVVGGYLAAHPSTTVLDEPAETARHERLAVQEWETEPLRPWVPNNTIRYEPYDARLHVMGSQTCADLQADFHTDTTELAVAILAAIRGGADRLVIALALMFAYARITLEPGITRGYMSYFSHATGFFDRRSSPESARVEFDRRYETRRESLAELLNEVLNTVETDDTTNPFITDWVRIARRYRQRSEPLIASGRVQWKHLDDRPVGKVFRGTGTGILADVRANDAWRAEVYESTWNQSHRLVLNFQYQLLSRLGIVPA